MGLFICVVVTLFGICSADLTNHRYKDSEPVILWANKGVCVFFVLIFFYFFFIFFVFLFLVGPFPNPQETYPFFSLPFCRHRELQHYHSEGLGETILGYDLIRTAIPILFKKSVEVRNLFHHLTICETTFEKNFFFLIFLKKKKKKN